MTLNIVGGDGLSVEADEISLDTDYADSRYVNETQANSINSAMITDNTITSADISTNMVSSIDGVINDGGDINLVAGSNVTITPNNTANTITIAAATGAGDNLGNHTASQNIKLNGNYLSGDGGNEGIFVTTSGSVGVKTSSPATHLHVNGSPVTARGQVSISAPAGEDAYISFYEGNNFKSC